jgi:hypothetical protein
MTPKYLGVSAFAKHVGLTDSTIQSYFLKGMLPAPEIYYLTGKGERPGWSIDTVEHWMNNRPGTGRRYASMKRHPSNNSMKENN